jgi:hypothetical protein
MNAVQYSAYGGGPDGLQVILFHFHCFLFSILYCTLFFHTLLPEAVEKSCVFYSLISFVKCFW